MFIDEEKARIIATNSRVYLDRFENFLERFRNFVWDSHVIIKITKFQIEVGISYNYYANILRFKLRVGFYGTIVSLFNIFFSYDTVKKISLN